jgi:hypothetical protein
VKQHTVDPHDTETSGSNVDNRLRELAVQRWDRSKSSARWQKAKALILTTTIGA